MFGQVIVLVAIILLNTSLSFAGGFGSLSVGLDDLEKNFQGLEDKLRSNDAAEEKLKFFREQEVKFATIFLQMKNEVKKNPPLAENPDFRGAYELYDLYIPLRELKLDSQGKLLKATCLEASSLASVKNRALSIEGDEAREIPKAAAAGMDLVSKICQ